jgi:hypothetical protein
LRPLELKELEELEELEEPGKVALVNAGTY